MKKVTYTAVATDRSGQQVRVDGSSTFDDRWISTRRASDVATCALQRRGYKNVRVADTTVTDS